MFLRYGDQARPGLTAQTCFEAVLREERTSTTRFREGLEAQFERWRSLRPGDLVRIWSGPYLRGRWVGEFALIEITEAPREVDLAVFTTEERHEWSIAEGWAPTKIDSWILMGHPTKGVQVRYRLSTHL
jgi:hypothetical protein